ncbi:ribonuclease HII [Lysinibacter cavernae]|uniref:Ribonuclease n=1 Tax=Lysinibacter cavernae TaxID=1640652 RepID=A0A7X5TRN6_9MICO|nr:ribonuclease HII [Lysinibacter cavernae]NIH52416.1 ribonuclease HII [Lysinibacter cavernae]
MSKAVSNAPTLDLEHELLSTGASLVIGCDEVGRGAIAGPVSVGVAAYDRGCGGFPEGLRDSKLLSEKRREALYAPTRAWVLHGAVGSATAAEVDELGINACLGLAARRALISLHELGVDVAASVVLLDGSADWLTPSLGSPLRVVTRVKADRDCASVAAASVLAKVERDRQMIELDAQHPGYSWAGNKGYGSAAHYAAIESLGATDYHRRSWLKGAGSLAVADTP